MARIETCPAGHRLALWTAEAGRCDGCMRYVGAGERVHDCRRCNYYLCDDCRPLNSQVGNNGFFGVVLNLFSGNGCGAAAADFTYELDVSDKPLPKMCLRHGADGEAPRRRRSSAAKGSRRQPKESTIIPLDGKAQPEADDPSPASTTATFDADDVVAYTDDSPCSAAAAMAAGA